MPDDETQFAQLVGKIMREEGASRTVAIQQAVSRMSAELLAAQSTTLACHSGCSKCCYTLVTVRPAEWQVIHEYMLTQGSAWIKRLTKRVSTLLGEWRAYARRPVPGRNVIEQTLRIYQDWQGKPCVFLGPAGECVVYPVRPVVCRVVTNSVSPCSGWDDPNIKRWRFPHEMVADKMATDDTGEQVAGLPPGVTPLVAMVAHHFRR